MSYKDTQTYKNHVKYENTMLAFKTVFIIGFVALFFYACYAFYGNEQTVTATVISFNTKMNVSGSDGNTYSTYEYLVTTDKGIFKNQPDGIFHSKAFGKLEAGKTYTFHIRGIECPIIGVYPFIIDAY